MAPNASPMTDDKKTKEEEKEAEEEKEEVCGVGKSQRPVEGSTASIILTKDILGFLGKIFFFSFRSFSKLC